MLIFYLFSTLEQVKKLRTERGRNVRRKNRRDHKQKGPSSKACNAAEGSSEESEVFIKIVHMYIQLVIIYTSSYYIYK